ncbi:class II aaRS and biotin synthetase [Lindgomyces ingoldianus]|uniref:Class II aaRS and biotin synthetase n=1 Tax=Lindgomyces ingoldianus TaxID=673940 RepID=A0ACB6QY04_9PLEO|nr:class II aaRS and biotin synthetase [Lindgomyces ingoldianus]KAF2470962.1 class II aaRS and biotin synthetase [Lindgomyces ingoldianus]
MTRIGLHFLRPCLSRSFQPLTKPEYTRIYCAIQRRCAQTTSHDACLGPRDTEKQKRLEQLMKIQPVQDYHPRLSHPAGVEKLSPLEFASKYEVTQETSPDLVSVFGRVRSVRLMGSKLIFIDIERSNHKLQIMVERRKLTGAGEDYEVEFKNFKQTIRTGDWISIRGNPMRTSTGQLSIVALDVPHIIAPCLHHIPERVENQEVLVRHPHLNQLIDRGPGDILRLRSFINNYLRSTFLGHGFIEVETPMFDVSAGGAIARPFQTVATEMSSTPIKLRIAPELNLKRLMVGGQDKIFELGRVFRNEGVDNTHNPEFTICEFYEAGATLQDLIRRTERLFQGLAEAIDRQRETEFPSIPSPLHTKFASPFRQLPFIPTIEKATNRKLPDLSSPNALTELLILFKDLHIPLPSLANLPRLLDALAEKYIEPLCEDPTFITNHPEALSPLSKSFVDPATSQRVASRVEFFINSREYVNAYEEENSPFEQRRKFQQQLGFHPDGSTTIDESYLEVLEWGLPPTGGWGCGVDRLVMLFAGKRRIADVLPFGTLRNVVSISKNGPSGRDE